MKVILLWLSLVHRSHRGKTCVRKGDLELEGCQSFGFNTIILNTKTFVTFCKILMIVVWGEIKSVCKNELKETIIQNFTLDDQTYVSQFQYLYQIIRS